MAVAPGLGSGGEIRAGSSPVSPTDVPISLPASRVAPDE